MPEISVIIPCHDYGRFLDEAIDSVLAQTYDDFEIIVVDDGSTEPLTRSLFDQFERPKTRLLRTEQQGSPAARNTGIRLSTGRYIVALDADDKLDPRYLEKTKVILDSDEQETLGFVTTWVQTFGDADEVIKAFDYSRSAIGVANPAHSSSMFRRRCWQEVHGYRESLSGWEDWNLWLNMVSTGYRWKVVPQTLFYYRKHGQTRSWRSRQNHRQNFAAIVNDNSELYRSLYPHMLAKMLSRVFELEDVWLEKDAALTDNQHLSEQLLAVQQRVSDIESSYRHLEAYTRHLESELRKERPAREALEPNASTRPKDQSPDLVE